MPKHKKKKKQALEQSVPDDLFSTAALSIRKFRKVTNEIAKLSSSQKLVGSLALVAAGLIYLQRHRIGQAMDTAIPALPNWSRPFATDVTSAVEESEPEPAAPHKSHRSAKTNKSRPAASNSVS